MLDLLNSTSFNWGNSRKKTKAKAGFENYLKCRWITVLLREVKDKPNRIFESAIWIP